MRGLLVTTERGWSARNSLGAYKEEESRTGFLATQTRGVD